MPVYDSTPLPAQAAAGADVNVLVGTYENEDSSGIGVSRVVVTPPAGFVTVTGVATNNATINVRQLRGGAVLSTFASLTLNPGTNLVAEVPVQVPITSSTVLSQDDVVDAVLHQNGTGVAVGAGLIVEVDIS